jgi:hypothetical protein
MSGSVPYDGPPALRIEEIKSKKRPYIDKYTKMLNDLSDRMLEIDVNQRITIEEILE